MSRLEYYGGVVSELVVEKKSVERIVEEERKNLEKAKEREDIALEAQRLMQSIVIAIQERICQKISEVVSRCLSAIFDDPYEFEVRLEKQRGKTEAYLVFKRGGLELVDPMNEVGGGVIDVAAFALRLACIMMSRPRKRKLLILDEPWKNIRGEAYRNRTRDLLLSLADELGIQFVLNTDIPNYRLGTVVEF